ncbi:MAG: transcriptional regulator [Caldilineaceae bacterium]|nr:transcriptional regulator [Caldilineaceae bacterium]MBP8109644.1 transcriptional regulator [Caldilineaceae bacterium]MBP8124364.1 transcriptional regulator [Caldilineaceae bacterium]MBP9074355.1 transcriptional regulator [Caldilineaceae bacterium]
MSLGLANQRGSQAWRIVEFLQRNGSASIRELEEWLQVTTTAVRAQLTALQAEGYVDRRRVSEGVGRPYHVYVTTDKVRELFDCHCDDLALTMMEEVLHIVGKDKVPALMGRVSDRLAQRYVAGVKAEAMQDRVHQLARVLGGQGVLTDVFAQENDTIILKTYNCPYHELAQEHREVCEMEQGMMSKVLGSEVNLSSCMMDGHSGCSFVVATR